MSEIATAIDRIRRVTQDRGSLVVLAEEAGVPYSTVHSFAKRGWSHKNIEVIEKLCAAAERIEERSLGQADAA